MRAAHLLGLGWAVAVGVGVPLTATFLRRRRPDPSPLEGRNVVVAVTEIGLLVILAGIVAVIVGLVGGTFGTMAVWWYGIVVGVPLAALVLAAGATRRSGGSGISATGRVALVAALVPGAVGVWGTWIEPYRLEVDRPSSIVVPASRSGDDPIRIGVLTDLQTTHIGSHEEAAVDALIAERPDLVLLPGDLYQGDGAGWVEAHDGFVRLLSRLRAAVPGPDRVFVVPGDVDTGPGGGSQGLEDLAAETGIRFLGDDLVTTTVGDRTVRIAGLRLAYDSPEATGAIAQLESLPGDDDIRILLSHRPDSALRVKEGTRIDVVVAGHTHGGQISVPFVGPLLTMTNVPRGVAAGGLHEMAGRRLYVGRGVGMERGEAPPVRLGVPPNIGLLTIADG